MQTEKVYCMYVSK